MFLSHDSSHQAWPLRVVPGPHLTISRAAHEAILAAGLGLHDVVNVHIRPTTEAALAQVGAIQVITKVRVGTDELTVTTVLGLSPDINCTNIQINSCCE